jgi:hypothetical protein
MKRKHWALRVLYVGVVTTEQNIKDKKGLIIVVGSSTEIYSRTLFDQMALTSATIKRMWIF